jgi:hypothetical protein
LKCECHSKTTVRLEECFPKASRSISRVLAMDLPISHAKLGADTFLDFSIHHRQNETRSAKRTCVKKCGFRGGVMWQTDAIGFQKCDLGLPSHLLSLRHLQQKQSGNFPIHLILNNIFCLHCVCL